MLTDTFLAISGYCKICRNYKFYFLYQVVVALFCFHGLGCTDPYSNAAEQTSLGQNECEDSYETDWEKTFYCDRPRGTPRGFGIAGGHANNLHNRWHYEWHYTDFAHSLYDETWLSLPMIWAGPCGNEGNSFDCWGAYETGCASQCWDDVTGQPTACSPTRSCSITQLENFANMFAEFIVAGEPQGAAIQRTRYRADGSQGQTPVCVSEVDGETNLRCGRSWLIFNEPNVRGQGNLDPVQAAHIYYHVAHAISEVDPTARFYVGGTLPSIGTHNNANDNPWWAAFLPELELLNQNELRAEAPLTGFHYHLYAGCMTNEPPPIPDGGEWIGWWYDTQLLKVAANRFRELMLDLGWGDKETIITEWAGLSDGTNPNRLCGGPSGTVVPNNRDHVMRGLGDWLEDNSQRLNLHAAAWFGAGWTDVNANGLELFDNEGTLTCLGEEYLGVGSDGKERYPSNVWDPGFETYLPLVTKP